MESTTIASPFVAQMLEGAIARGFNVDRLLKNNGISPDILRQPRARVTFAQLARLGQALTQLMDDELYGLMERPQRRNTFRLLGYSLLQAATLGEALEIYRDFQNMLENSLTCRLQPGEAQTAVQFVRRYPDRIRNDYAIEQTLLVLHRTLCWLVNAPVPLRRVELDYPQPWYHGEYRYLFYNAPVYFRSRESALVIGSAALQLRTARDRAQLDEFVAALPLTLLSQTFTPTELSTQVRAWLERRITQERRAPDMPGCAAQFRMHPQALRRQLGREQTSYQEIKMQTRRDLAINRLHQPELRIEEIAAALGFSEPSAFIRAFRQWTGLTPLAYRNMSLSRE